MIAEFIQGVITGFNNQSLLELIAVLTSITYLLLAMKENQWCWPFAFVGTAIYVYLFWNVFLFMDSLLHIYYLVMAIYGWWSWHKQKAPSLTRHNTEDIAEQLSGNLTKSEKAIQTWPLYRHAAIISAVLVASGINGLILSTYTEAAWPYLDSFTTWASVVTTYMVTQKVLENWLYWIVIDSVAMCLYIERGLDFTALLFFAYVVIVIIGFFNWRNRIATA